MSITVVSRGFLKPGFSVKYRIEVRRNKLPDQELTSSFR